jgi:PDZ domain-containing protein
VLRQKKQTTVRVVTAVSPTQAGQANVGITIGTGYSYAPSISFELGRKIGGPSAGLVFALAIYDKLTPGALLAGQHLAGTGTINPEGQVGGIGGIQEKIAGAEDAGATTFLVPAANCGDLAGVRTSMRLVKVATLSDAVAAATALGTPGQADALPRC